jgi:hypothetical protein
LEKVSLEGFTRDLDEKLKKAGKKRVPTLRTWGETARFLISTA